MELSRENMKSSYKTVPNAVESERGKFGFYLTLAYLFIEYARPADLFPLIGYIRPAAIVSVLLLLTSLNSLDIHKIKKPQIILFALFILLSTSLVPFAHNGRVAYGVTMSMVLYFVFAISVVIHINTLKRLKIFLTFWMITTVYIAVKGVFHGVGEGIGGSSFLSDENDFSMFLNMMLPFSLYLFMIEKRTLRKNLYLLSGILLLAGIVISFSRGGFVGLLATLFTMLMFSKRKIVTFVLVVFLALLLYSFADTMYWNEMSTITDTSESTASMRFDAWTGAWHMFIDNPLGVGPGNFPFRYPNYQPEHVKRNMWGFPAHSLWFTLIPELGVFGIIIYIFWLYHNIKDIFRVKRFKDNPDPDISFFSYLSMAYLAGLAGFFASASFLSALYYPHYFYFTAIIVATKNIAELHSTDSDDF